VPSFAELAQASTPAGSTRCYSRRRPTGHLAQARALFAAGLPLLAEKPLSLDLAEAVEIVGLAARHRVPLASASTSATCRSARAARRAGAARRGEPGFGQFTYQRNRDGSQSRLNKYPLTMRHPMMLEQSIHHLDLIRYCYAREVVASRADWNPAWSMYAHDSNVSCLLTLEGGSRSTISAPGPAAGTSCASSGGPTARVAS
jgi:predicted dehydrogenase